MDSKILEFGEINENIRNYLESLGFLYSLELQGCVAEIKAQISPPLY